MHMPKKQLEADNNLNSKDTFCFFTISALFTHYYTYVECHIVHWLKIIYESLILCALL